MKMKKFSIVLFILFLLYLGYCLYNIFFKGQVEYSFHFIAPTLLGILTLLVHAQKNIVNLFSKPKNEIYLSNVVGLQNRCNKDQCEKKHIYIIAMLSAKDLNENEKAFFLEKPELTPPSQNTTKTSIAWWRFFYSSHNLSSNLPIPIPTNQHIGVELKLSLTNFNSFTEGDYTLQISFRDKDKDNTFSEKITFKVEKDDIAKLEEVEEEISKDKEPEIVWVSGEN